ncbi:Kdo hydroxylase family protein [Legionella spiritensis]|uniref:3-deoxy-D-manno-oct-2-ulosonic acid (Kdo) hydroxylase n=1 Tax=Legionella spiritensis TaxID=452 RepID=A0A0W0YWV4_LEGSP|nr:Kdo hydroxylase family protein [Legionella spiritensis]KTD61353.1 hypothetical protein Lspi_2595 [Legionella spiritensis]SNV33816.1 Protein of uncharacterised function (DUF2843) [Legionella spiritensis]VEG92443.1 Protein of uncharacterised function (DUF2843) [Legionella spiritensis]
MTEYLFTLDTPDIRALAETQKQQAQIALESGQVIFFPSYSFSSEHRLEQNLLSDTILDGKHKNISFDIRTKKTGGFNKRHNDPSLASSLHTFLSGYAQFAKNLIDTVLPGYSDSLRWGRTSYRPAEVEGRNRSKRQDDTRLHVDAFSSTPVYGRRILRVFCNINPDGKPRVWHLGEPFNDILARFAKTIPDYSRTKARLLQWIKATKTLRSAYDHYQLHLHDNMKLDDNYQQTVTKHRVEFPALSTWIVFTDQTSHAALSGQYLLEQTFYLPVSAMDNVETSPLKCWEKERASIIV